LLFSIPEFSMYEGERIGLVGLNGCGKTTLLNLLCGKVIPDKGTVHIYGTIAYCPQLPEHDEKTESHFSDAPSNPSTQSTRLSGGEKTRLRLANTFESYSNLYLFDEPTANLDIEGISLLTEQLANIRSLIVVSHDAFLLDALCNRIIEIREGKLFSYTGNYSEYLRQKEAAFNRAEKEYFQYIEERDRLNQAFAEKKANAERMKKKPKHMSSSDIKVQNYTSTCRSNDGRQKSMQRQAKAIQSRLDHLEIKEKPKSARRIQMDFSLTKPPEGKIVVRGEHVDFAYGQNQLFCDAMFEIRNGHKVAVIGPNGIGKSTLLNCIYKGISDIKIAPKARMGILYQEFDNLDPELTVLQIALRYSIQKESVVRSILAKLLFREQDIKKTVAMLSGGEKIKLSLACLISSEVNTLLLDEPTNYLDAQSVEALKEVLTSYSGTVIFASHDRAFIEAVAEDILLITNKKITLYPEKLSAYAQQTNPGNGRRKNGSL